VIVWKTIHNSLQCGRTFSVRARLPSAPDGMQNLTLGCQRELIIRR
jgi:hypothetical protein